MKEEESLVVPKAPKVENPKVDYYGKPFKYIANNKVKAEGTVMAYTKEMIEEIMKCRKDIYYFAENYYKIVHPDFGFMNIDLRDYQYRCLQEFVNNRFNICKWPRQSGKCCSMNSVICVRNKKTGEIKKITMGELYKDLSKE